MANSDVGEQKAVHYDAEGGEEQGGLLDQPLVVEGKRSRKSTETFAVKHEAKRPATKYEGGSGTRLGEIARVEHFVSKHTSEDLKPLHRLCFDRPGAKAEVKKNLRGFSGFGFTRDSEQFQRKKAALDKMTKSGLRVFLEVLDLARSGSKEEQIESILAFLLEPHDSGKPVPKPKQRKRSSSSRKGAKGGHTKRTKKSTSSASEVDEEDDELEEEEEEEEEENESSMPTDGELFATVQGILKGADLESITTNSVCKQVFAKYPSLDLSERKDYLKNCIDEVLAAS